MTPVRRWILLAGPLPIVWASIAFSHWAKPAKSPPVTPNHADGAVTANLASAAPRKLVAPLGAACEATAKTLRARLGEDCAVIVHSPFVLAGDLARPELEQWLNGTILPAERAMNRAYFRKTPDKPITVLLFRGETSYNAYAARLFGEEVVSIYGYYKPRDRALLLNIATGGGTLTHELTHALLDFDFPAAPSWFNEGLASLHEQCRFRADENGIDGLENWRLPGLQAATRAGRLRSINALASDADFRGADIALNYAHARYFCLYLQRKQLLTAYYQRFRENHAEDPTGAASIQHVLNVSDWKKIDDDFQRWVLELKPAG